MQRCRETGSCASSWCRRQKVLGMGKRAIQGAFPDILVDGAEKHGNKLLRSLVDCVGLHAAEKHLDY